MLRLGFDDLGFHRITAVVIDGNEASARLLGRLGFRQEARLVDNVLFKGSWATQLVFAHARGRVAGACLIRPVEQEEVLRGASVRAYAGPRPAVRPVRRAVRPRP